MAKKSSTIHVEGFVWDEIENIQKSQGISSRNTAIEYLVAEYRGLKKQTGNTEITNKEDENHKVDENKPSTDLLASRLKQMENDMMED